MPKLTRSKTTKPQEESSADFFASSGTIDDFFNKLRASPTATPTPTPTATPTTTPAPTPRSSSIQVIAPIPRTTPPPVVVGPAPIESNLPGYSLGAPLAVVGKNTGAPATNTQLPAYWSGGKNMAALMNAAAEKNSQDWGAAIRKMAEPVVSMVGSVKEALSESLKAPSVSVAPQKMTLQEYEAAKKKNPALYKG